jgi:hypothetical protein
MLSFFAFAEVPWLALPRCVLTRTLTEVPLRVRENRGSKIAPVLTRRARAGYAERFVEPVNAYDVLLCHMRLAYSASLI